MRDYYELICNNDNEDDYDKLYGLTLKLHTIFETILKTFTKEGKFKDSWDFPARINLSAFGQQASIRSEKLEVDFDFGIDYADFSPLTYLIYPSYIKNMDNSFWSNFTN